MKIKSVTERYRAVNEGTMTKKEFVRQMRQQYPMHVTQFNGFDDSVQILKNRGLLFETKKVEEVVYDERPVLNYSLGSLDRGIRAEIKALGKQEGETVSAEDFKKAEKKAKDNLEKNPTHYLDLVSGESSKVNKHDREVETKRGKAEVDVFNGMKKATLKESGYTENQISTAIAKIKERKGLTTEEPTSSKKEILAAAINAITAEYQEIPGLNAIIKDFLHTKATGLMNNPDMDPVSEFDEFISVNYDSLQEKEGKDHDRDGDIDGDDYMAAKDKAIKGAMGKSDDKNNDFINPGNTVAQAKNRKDYLKRFGSPVDEKELADKDYDGNGKIETGKKEHRGARTKAIKRAMKTEGDSENLEAEFRNNLAKVNFRGIVDKYAPKGLNNLPTEDDYIKAWENEGGLDPDFLDIRMLQQDIIDYARKLDNQNMAENEDSDLETKFREALFKINFKVLIDKYTPRNVNNLPDEDDYIKAWQDSGGLDPDYLDPKLLQQDVIHYAKNLDNQNMAESNAKLKEAVKSIIRKVLTEESINEAATGNLSHIADEYDGFQGMQNAINQLENIVTDVEAYYSKVREKIQKVYGDLGNITNEEGLKVGGFLAPAIESAFMKDLRPVIAKGFIKGLDLPKVKTVSSKDIEAHNSGERPLGEEGMDKQTMFTPVYESKKK